jgi:hypothetical protein
MVKDRKTVWKLQTIRMTEEDLEKLEEIATKKYRTNSRAQAIRWMIEDAWKEMKNDQH